MNGNSYSDSQFVYKQTNNLVTVKSNAPQNQNFMSRTITQLGIPVS